MQVNKVCFALLLCFTLSLAGCSTHRTIVERNADHLAFQMAEQDFSASLETQVPDTAKSLTGFLQHYYDEGKKIHAAGVTEDQALAIAALLRERIMQGQLPSHETFAGKTYTSAQSETIKKLVAQTVANTFIDGYNGAQ
ncbi:Exc2 family lipoprotein [Tatumella citrea]|uniref:Entry exclusion protein 2 n=1 Tax=Tatumella citrea TaxID=53336 RepID=A0A1Y0LQU6_TATCI|nr:Exc2 family lipoprotein [Tatumella citrea]ARU95859.1 hypothetical protein A7K98_20380 [Tatumella citrea]ARU99899.1 hypothetical protein A7K99_20365 [Tatumella citrea]